MSDTRNPYETLGVSRDADAKTIRKAYRKLARQNHPDLNPGDAAAEERFKEVSRAFEVLADPEKRRAYDEFGEVSLESGFDAEKARKAREAFGARFGGGARGGFSGGEEFRFGDVDDLLGRFFSGGGAGGPRMPGGDLEATLELDFEEALRGGEKRLTLGRPGRDGSLASETLTVRIPPGVDTGGTLRLPGKGAPGIGGGPPGDLRVTLRVHPHRIFRREGRHLCLDLPVHVREATLGGRVEVPTLDGRATLTIPPGTDSGTRLRMRGKGVPDPRGGKPGDLLVRIQVRVPRGLDAEGEAALKTLSRFEDPGIRKEILS